MLEWQRVQRPVSFHTLGIHTPDYYKCDDDRQPTTASRSSSATTSSGVFPWDADQTEPAAWQRAFASAMRPNGTLWFLGDSLSTQHFLAMACALDLDGACRSPALHLAGRFPDPWGRPDLFKTTQHLRW